MANTINVNIRVDEELKKQTENLLSDMGLNMTTAVNIFLRQIVRTGGIPFEITTRTDDFYNPVNQRILYESINRLEQGMGTVHELTEVDE
ncbi:MAG TPA: type II toxin-antitoxin system RelB/DinJ family antitoxin [Clostridiales bacterium]|nr:type II toxin-antitoxin system RelB/DinJ family antitoxin [Clostridiales bacterium]